MELFGWHSTMCWKFSEYQLFYLALIKGSHMIRDESDVLIFLPKVAFAFSNNNSARRLNVQILKWWISENNKICNFSHLSSNQKSTLSSAKQV